MKTVLSVLVILASIGIYSQADACHKYICVSENTCDGDPTYVICRVDRKSLYDKINCWTTDKKPNNVGKCMTKVECKCPLCPDPPPCPKCPKCEECKKCPKCEPCPPDPCCPECNSCCEDCPEYTCEKCNCPELTCENKPDAGPIPDAGPVDPEDDDLKALAGGCSMGGDSMSGGIFIIPILGLLLMLFAVHRIRSAIIKWSLYTVGLITCIAPPLHAFPTQQLHPAPGSHDYIVTQDAKITLPSIKLLWHIEEDPLTIRQKPGNDRLETLIDSRNTLNIMGAIPLGKRLQLAADIPAVLRQSGPEDLEGGAGNIRLLVKGLLYNSKFFNAGLSLGVALPTATASYTREDSGAFTPQLLLSGSPTDWLDLATNVGFRLRETQVFNEPGFQRYDTGNLFTASAAARFKVLDRSTLGLNIISDLNLSTTMSSVTQEEVSLEWLNGLSVRLPAGFKVFGGVGVGSTRGVGTPEARGMLSLSWAWQKEEYEECRDRTIVKIKEKIKRIPIAIPVPDTVVLPPIYFDTDKATLRPESIDILDGIVSGLKANPHVTKIRAEGYCDHRASQPYNMGLSKRRVQVAVDYLKSKGISLKRIESRHFGENNRVDKSKTEEGMQRNRRVEFYITEIKR